MTRTPSPPRSAAPPASKRVATRTQADLPMSDRRYKTRRPRRRTCRQRRRDQPRSTSSQGNYPIPAPDDQAVVERHTADTFGLAAGQRVQVFDGTAWHEVTISGVAQSPEYLWPARNRQDVLGDPHAFAVLFAPEPLARDIVGAHEAKPDVGRDVQALQRNPTGTGCHPAAPCEPAPRTSRTVAISHPMPRCGKTSTAFVPWRSGFPRCSYRRSDRRVRVDHPPHPHRTTDHRHPACPGCPPRRSRPALHVVRRGRRRSRPRWPGSSPGQRRRRAYTHAYASLLRLPGHRDRAPNPHRRHRISSSGSATGVIAGLAPAIGAARTTPAEAMRGDGCPPDPE